MRWLSTGVLVGLAGCSAFGGTRPLPVGVEQPVSAVHPVAATSPRTAVSPAAPCRDDAARFARAIRTSVDHDGDELGAVTDAALVRLGHAALEQPSVLETTRLVPFQRQRFLAAAQAWLCNSALPASSPSVASRAATTPAR